MGGQQVRVCTVWRGVMTALTHAILVHVALAFSGLALAVATCIPLAVLSLRSRGGGNRLNYHRDRAGDPNSPLSHSWCRWWESDLFPLCW